MRIPLHTMKVSTDDKRKLGNLLSDEYLAIPPEVEQLFEEADLFAIRLYIEDFVVGLIPGVRSGTDFQHRLTPRYQIKIELGIKYFSICFNGHRKLFNW